MHAELVKLDVDPRLTREQALIDARGTIPHWRANPDLIRKHYLYGEDGCLYGLYLWTSREAALKAHDEAWRAGAKARIGADPVVSHFDVMMILDNPRGTVEEFDAK